MIIYNFEFTFGHGRVFLFLTFGHGHGWNTWGAIFVQLLAATGARDMSPTILLEDADNPSFVEEISFLVLYSKNRRSIRRINLVTHWECDFTKMKLNSYTNLGVGVGQVGMKITNCHKFFLSNTSHGFYPCKNLSCCTSQASWWTIV